jgi:hypothetical protein
MITYQALIIAVVVGRQKYKRAQFNKAVASGQIKVVKMVDLISELNNQDKKKWN